MAPILLGTGAAEGIPCIFCKCPVCSYARQHGGRDTRSRSGFLIDNQNIIDFPRDLFHQLLQTGINIHIGYDGMEIVR